MKKLPLLLAFLSGIAVTAAVGWKNNPAIELQPAYHASKANPDNRRIIAIRKMKLKPGVTAEQFEAFAKQVAEGDHGALPGIRLYFGKADRGQEIGTYVGFTEFDSKATRSFYAPTADNADKDATEAAKKMLEPYFSQYLPTLGKLCEIPFPDVYTDYLILE